MRLVTVLLSILLFAGCHSHVRVDVPHGQPAQPAASTEMKLHPGDQVRVTLTDGKTVTFVVATIEPDALVGSDGRRVLYSDMSELEKRHVSAGKTTALIAGAVVVIPLLILVLAAATA